MKILRLCTGFNWMCILEWVEKFVGGVVHMEIYLVHAEIWWWVVIWEFSVLIWSKSFTFKLKFCFGPSRTIYRVYGSRWL